MTKKILIRPIITEKSMLATSHNRYTFEVNRGVSKGQIRKTIEATFGVEVIGITTTKLASKIRRVGRFRKEIKKLAGKKATVELKSGQTIDIFEAQGK